jgi:hypothetical protein
LNGYGRKIWPDLMTEGIFENTTLVKGIKYNKDKSIR